MPVVPPNTRQRAACNREDGITLIEVMIVIVIVAILMSIAVPAFTTSRHTANSKLVRTTAASYREAIDAFTLDRSGRVPDTADANQWPASAIAAGPLEPVNDPRTGLPRTYLRGTPTSVSDGTVLVLPDAAALPPAGGPMPAGGSDGIIRYVRDRSLAPSVRYRLEVYVRTPRRKMPNVMTCWYGTSAPTTTPPVKEC